MRCSSLVGTAALAAGLIAWSAPASAQADEPISRCAKTPNAPPKATLSLQPQASPNVFEVQVTASDPDGDRLEYIYSSTTGRISQGEATIWDLSGVAPGSYTLTAEVDDGRGCVTMISVTASAE